MGLIKVTLVKSKNGSTESQKATLQSLGLNKISQWAICEDNAVYQGMITKVQHLVKVEEVKK